MKSFQQTFNELKKARGLSNKQIASFTGVKLKDVKQWETGTSFPIETKVVDALEGLLGTEISKSLEGYTSQSKVNSQLKTSEDNIFIVKNEKLDVTNTKIDKLRNLFQKQPQNTTASSQEKDALRSIVDELQSLRKLLSTVLDK